MTLSGERPGQHATTTAPTVADGLAEALRAVGVRRIFGVPGSGSSLDIIAAADARGLEFVLTQTETAAALMAAVTAELSGAPGVVVTGLGPGTASAVNGIAYAALERAPVLLISDVADDDPGLFSVHQRFDQGALLAPLCKRTVRLRGADAAATIAAALDAAMALPPGPVFLELSAREAARPLAGPLLAPEPSRRHDGPAEGDVAAARTLLARSQRPVIVAGLQARHAVAASALGRLLDELACPILTTYKAKGVVPDRDRRVIGHFTGGKAEADGVSRADLILFYGVDPVELVHHVWRYQAPLVELASVAGMPQPATPAATLVGPLAVSVERLRGIDRGSRWTPAEMASLQDRLRARLAIGAMNGHSPQAVVEATRAAAPAECRATVDSGAHMFSAMTYWQAERPFDVRHRRRAGGAAAAGRRLHRRRRVDDVPVGAGDRRPARLSDRGRGVQRRRVVADRHQAAATRAAQPRRALSLGEPGRRGRGARLSRLARGPAPGPWADPRRRLRRTQAGPGRRRRRPFGLRRPAGRAARLAPNLRVARLTPSPTLPRQREGRNPLDCIGVPSPLRATSFTQVVIPEAGLPEIFDFAGRPSCPGSTCAAGDDVMDPGSQGSHTESPRGLSAPGHFVPGGPG
jgi:acetolactate synthase-1/2/3 large subunit